jgi:predicted transposase/invertase (TIGR01784 family)
MTIKYSKRKKKEQTEVYFPRLLEHKSYPDTNVAFQMLEYIALGYQTQLKNTQELELTVPVLYYHGQEKLVQAMLRLFKSL